MARFGFCGGSYRSQSVNADDQMCMNLYVERDESGAGKSDAVLYSTPGTAIFFSQDSKTRGSYKLKPMNSPVERMFVAASAGLYEVASDGTATLLGNIQDDGLPVSFTSTNTEIVCCSAGHLYVYNIQTATFTADPAGISNVSLAGFLDGYIIALLNDSSQFQISGLFDATSWNPADKGQVSVYQDDVVSMFVDHREIWLLGTKATIVYYNNGDADFPFVPNLAGFIEQGCAAKNSVAKMDNSLFWLGADERGAGIIWRANGYTPVRISTHAVEYAIQGYTRIDDAVAYTYQDQGHAFYVLYFPTPSKTWVFDSATNLWHERGYWSQGVFTAHRSWNHMYCFGKHIVGDWDSGNFYHMDISILDDNDNPLRRVRRAPHIANEADWVFYDQLQVDLEAGLGTQTGQGQDPQIGLRWSSDGGHTWTDYLYVSAGKAGKYNTRAIWRRLGRGRDRIFEVVMSDPIPWRLVNAYLKASPGYSGNERISSTLLKQA